MLAINRIVIGKFRYFLYGLAMGAFVSVVVLVAIGEAESLFKLFSGDWIASIMFELTVLATMVLAWVLLDYLFTRKK